MTSYVARTSFSSMYCSCGSILDIPIWPLICGIHEMDVSIRVVIHVADVAVLSFLSDSRYEVLVHD